LLYKAPHPALMQRMFISQDLGLPRKPRAFEQSNGHICITYINC